MEPPSVAEYQKLVAVVLEDFRCRMQGQSETAREACWREAVLHADLRVIMPEWFAAVVARREELLALLATANRVPPRNAEGGFSVSKVESDTMLDARARVVIATEEDPMAAELIAQSIGGYMILCAKRFAEETLEFSRDA